MPNCPQFEFYVKDSLADAPLRRATPAARGIWINALCPLWLAEERGRMTGTARELARLFRASQEEFEDFLAEARRINFCGVSIDVTGRSRKITLVSRRIHDEWKALRDNALRQRRFRDKYTRDAKITPPSSSSSSFASSTTSSITSSTAYKLKSFRSEDVEAQNENPGDGPDRNDHAPQPEDGPEPEPQPGPDLGPFAGVLERLATAVAMRPEPPRAAQPLTAGAGSHPPRAAGASAAGEGRPETDVDRAVRRIVEKLYGPLWKRDREAFSFMPFFNKTARATLSGRVTLDRILGVATDAYLDFNAGKIKSRAAVFTANVNAILAEADGAQSERQ